jgi:flagellar L-ring protein precursor FlgH
VTKATGALANLLGTKGDQELKGTGTIGRTTVISTTLGTRVVHVLPNGYLVVEGVKEIRVSSEQQVITVRGVVRPADLGPNNVVQSDLIFHPVPGFDGAASVLGWRKRCDGWLYVWRWRPWRPPRGAPRA